MTGGRVVVVGGGLAALSAIETLREAGHEGQLVLLGEEGRPPYDRPPLSKGVLTGELEPGATTLRPRSFLEELGVELRLGAPAVGLDLERRLVLLEDEVVLYDRLLLATGSRARMLPLLAGRSSVYTIRTLDDAVAVRSALDGARRLIVVGAGFLGAEIASSARARGLDVDIVEFDEAPLIRHVGRAVSELLSALHAASGIRLHLGRTVAEIVDGPPVRVGLDNGESLDADVVVVAVGAMPNIEWLQGSGLELDGGVMVDATLRASVPDVWAVGDIATWPNELFGRRMRVEHWTNALEQGRHAALDLLGKEPGPFAGLNYVWSDLYGERIQLTGSLVDAEPEVVRGSLDGRPCLVWYRAEGRLVGAFGLSMPKELNRSRRLIARRSSWDEALADLSE